MAVDTPLQVILQGRCMGEIRRTHGAFFQGIDKAIERIRLINTLDFLPQGDVSILSLSPA